VVVADVNRETAEGVSKEAGASGVDSIPFEMTVTKLPDISRMVGFTIDRFKHVDILVNNAGVIQYRPIFDISERDCDFVLGVNMRGLFFCLQAAAREMAKRKTGSIVNVASVVGKIGSEGLVHYSASKSGVIGITRAASRALAPHRIRVNADCPGTVMTALQAQLDNEISKVLGEPPAKIKRLEKEVEHVPMKRYAMPEEVANVVDLLAYDDASYVTGQSYKSVVE